jgi:hypothetical protein
MDKPLTFSPSASASADSWEELEPVIERIYFDPQNKLMDIVLIITANHKFVTVLVVILTIYV